MHLYCSISSSQKYKLTHSSTAHATQTLQLVNTSSTPQSHSTPSNPNVHRYSNLHGNSHCSYGNLHRRPDNHHGTKRKWSNMTYLPPPRSSTATEPNIVSLTSLKRVSFKQSEEEKCKGRGNLTTAEGGLMSTFPRTTTIPPHLTWQSATASPHRGQTSHTKKSISPVSELQHQRHQTVVSNEATPISKSSHPTVSRRQLDTASDEATPLSKSSHPTVSRRQLGTASTKYKWRRRSTSHSEFISQYLTSHPLYITGCPLISLLYSQLCTCISRLFKKVSLSQVSNFKVTHTKTKATHSFLDSPQQVQTSKYQSTCFLPPLCRVDHDSFYRHIHP